MEAQLRTMRMGVSTVVLLGAHTVPASRRHDLDATNAAIRQVLAEPRSQTITLQVSVYGIVGEAVEKKKTKVLLEVNVYNVLLAAAQGRVLCFLARESGAGDRDDGDSNVYVFRCADEAEATRLASNMNRAVKTLFETISVLKRKRSKELLESLKPEDEGIAELSQMPAKEASASAQNLRKEIEKLNDEGGLGFIPEEEGEEAAAAQDSPADAAAAADNGEEDESFLGMAAGLEAPSKAFMRSLSKRLVRRGTKEIKLKGSRAKVRRAQRRAADDYVPPSI